MFPRNHKPHKVLESFLLNVLKLWIVDSDNESISNTAATRIVFVLVHHCNMPTTSAWPDLRSAVGKGFFTDEKKTLASFMDNESLRSLGLSLQCRLQDFLHLCSNFNKEELSSESPTGHFHVAGYIVERTTVLIKSVCKLTDPYPTLLDLAATLKVLRFGRDDANGRKKVIKSLLEAFSFRHSGSFEQVEKLFKISGAHHCDCNILQAEIHKVISEDLLFVNNEGNPLKMRHVGPCGYSQSIALWPG